METVPTGKENPKHGCHFIVGIQCLGSLKTLNDVYSSADYQPTVVSELLRDLLFRSETNIEPFLKSLHQLGKRCPRINVQRVGSPAKFLEDVFPLIFKQEKYPILIRTVPPDKWNNLTKAFFRNFKKQEIKKGKLMETVKMILIEGQYLEPAAKDMRAGNSKKGRFSSDDQLVFKNNLTRAGIDLKYKLVSVIEHIRCTKGHYVAYVMRSIGGVETWFTTDDEDIKPIAYDEVRKIAKPEFLVYELIRG